MNDYIPKILPKGTTIEQWGRYAEDMKRHEARCEQEEPVPPPHFNDQETNEAAQQEYKRLYSQWEMMRSCDEPNKPGYYRANND